MLLVQRFPTDRKKRERESEWVSEKENEINYLRGRFLLELEMAWKKAQVELLLLACWLFVKCFSTLPKSAIKPANCLFQTRTNEEGLAFVKRGGVECWGREWLANSVFLALQNSFPLCLDGNEMRWWLQRRGGAVGLLWNIAVQALPSTLILPLL